MGAGQDRPGHPGPASPRTPGRCRRGQELLGQRLCFPDSSSFAGAAPRRGAGCSRPWHPKKMAKGQESEEGGGGRPSGLGQAFSAPPPGSGRVPRRRPHPMQQVCAPAGGARPRLGPRRSSPTHLQRRRRSAARGARGAPSPRRQGSGSGLRGGCRGGAHHLRRVTGSSGAAA